MFKSAETPFVLLEPRFVRVARAALDETITSEYRMVTSSHSGDSIEGRNSIPFSRGLSQNAVLFCRRKGQKMDKEHKYTNRVNKGLPEEGGASRGLDKAILVGSE